MPLWLDQLLREPAFGCELVAGAGGMRRRGPIRWAHISELPDPTPWLEGGELLLTTGLGVRDSADLQRRLLAGLDERGCVGVGFALGIWMDDVPPAMREEAERRGLPLFTVPYEVPFIAVTKRVSRHIFDEHYATLRSAVELHRQVLAAVLSGAGILGVLEAFSRPMPGHDFVIFDYLGQVLARRDAEGEEGAVDAERLWDLVGDVRGRREHGRLQWQGRTVLAAPVRLGDQVEAVLAVVGHSPLEHELLLLEQGLTGISLELARGLSLREARRSRVDELLAEVAEGVVGPRPIARQLARLGVDVDAGYRMLCLRRPDPLGDRGLCALVEDTTVAPVAPIVGRHDGAVFCLVHPPLESQAQRISEALEARGWHGVVIGQSQLRKGADALAAAMREARIAATAPADDSRTVRDVTALGLTGLLAGIDDTLGADAFVQQILGPVLAYDLAEGAHLTASLRAYLGHGCRPGPAAAELCVHRHTLTYRLDRIAELTGRDPRNGAHLLAFGLALELQARRSTGGG